jgi:hypothetical protein
MPDRKIRHKNITRVDHPKKGTHGYNVRIQWAGERRSRFFSDAVYGDRLGALDAAIEWRNTTEKELGKPRTDRFIVGASRTSTGVVGVRRRKRGSTEVFEATWVTPRGKIRRTSYSIARHGERRALQKAQKARMLHERERLLAPSDEYRPRQ